MRLKYSLLEQPPKLEYADQIQRTPGDPIYFAPHHHQDVTELLLLVEGEASYQIDGQPYTAGPGSLVCFNQGVWHEERSSADKPFHFYYIGVSGMQVSDLAPNAIIDRSESPVVPLMDQSIAIRQRMTEIVRETNGGAPEAAWIGNGLTTALIGELVRLLHHRSGRVRTGQSHTQTVAVTKRYIEEHYSANITLERLSGIAYVSPYHLCRLFKKELGCSPIQYMIHRRIEAAQYYLSTTDMTVDKIAKRVGYESDTSFQNAFKKRVGLSPGQYRAIRSQLIAEDE